MFRKFKAISDERLTEVEGGCQGQTERDRLTGRKQFKAVKNRHGLVLGRPTLPQKIVKAEQ